MVLYPMSPLLNENPSLSHHKPHPSCNLLNKNNVDIYPRKTIEINCFEDFQICIDLENCQVCQKRLFS